MSMKNSSDTTGNRTRDILACSTVPIILVKGKVHPITSHQGPRGGGRGIVLLILDLDARRGGWSAPRPGRFTPGKDPVPIVQEAGWAPGPAWTCAKNLTPIRI
jgi:hypothetical protein